MKSLICKQCESPFDIIHTGKRHIRLFCTQKCSQQWQIENLTKPHNGTGIKFCAHCKIPKNIIEFGRKGATRIQSYCKSCLYFFQMRRWNKQKIRAIAYLGGVCSSCNEKFHPAIYDFHHRDPAIKEFGWDKLRKKSWDKIIIELDKCDLVCANCHRLNHVTFELWDFDDGIHKAR